MRTIAAWLALILAAHPGLAEEGNSTPTVYGEPLETRTWTEDPSPEQVRVFSDSELKQIRSSANQIKAWSERYPHENVVPGTLSIPILDFLWYEWLEDKSDARPPAGEVITVLGAAFGHYLSIELKMSWVEVTDKYGTNKCVRGAPPGNVTVCPESVVAKRVETEGIDFFAGIFEATKQQIAELGS